MKQTPRDLFLNRHRGAEPKLEALSQAVIDGLSQPAAPAARARASAPRHHALPGWLRELLWPCPQAWAGLAAVWVVILVFGLVTAEEQPETLARRTPPSPEVRMALQAQERLRQELLPEPGPAEPARTGPRSDRRRELLMA